MRWIITVALLQAADSLQRSSHLLRPCWRRAALLQERSSTGSRQLRQPLL